jgi:hypothetical protein
VQRRGPLGHKVDRAKNRLFFFNAGLLFKCHFRASSKHWKAISPLKIYKTELTASQDGYTGGRVTR